MTDIAGIRKQILDNAVVAANHLRQQGPGQLSNGTRWVDKSDFIIITKLQPGDFATPKYEALVLTSDLTKVFVRTGLKTNTSPAGALHQLLHATCELLKLHYRPQAIIGKGMDATLPIGEDLSKGQYNPSI